MTDWLALPSHPGLLPKWLLLVSGIAIGNSVQTFVTDHYNKQIYSNKPELVNELQGRTFAVWTVLSAFIRYYAAYNITDPSWYNLAIASYGVAAGHFLSEWLVFRTANPGKGLFSPIIVFSITLPWMLLQRSYYVH